MSNFSEIHNMVINTAMSNKGTIVLKPSQGSKIKIKHYNLLKKLNGQSNTVLENYIDPKNNINIQLNWQYSIKEIGEYTYYYLSMKVLNIKLDIVKKNDNSSIYVFLKYSSECHYLAAIILDKYLSNYWKIENI